MSRRHLRQHAGRAAAAADRARRAGLRALAQQWSPEWSAAYDRALREYRGALDAEKVARHYWERCE